LRARIQSLVEGAQKTVPFRVVAAFGDSQASNYALALAFAGFMSMFPLILGALSIIGLAIRDPATESRFQMLVLQLFPSSAQPELQSALRGVKQSAGWFGFISLGGLLWSASSIFGTMEFALTQIFGTKQRDMLRQKLMGLVMMVLLIVAIVITVGVNALAAFLPYTWITSLVTGSIVMVGLLVAMYRLVPNRTFALSDVLPGALLAGVLIEVLSLAFPLYARIAGSFNTYGAQFGLFFLLATWFYLLSELILLGAVYNRFRMGEPDTHGLIASPMRLARETKSPVEAVKEQQVETTEPPATRPPRSVFQRVALALVVAVAAAGAVVRRRGRAKSV
jgi:membrane protein